MSTLQYNKVSSTTNTDKLVLQCSGENGNSLSRMFLCSLKRAQCTSFWNSLPWTVCINMHQCSDTILIYAFLEQIHVPAQWLVWLQFVFVFLWHFAVGAVIQHCLQGVMTYCCQLLKFYPQLQCLYTVPATCQYSR